MKKLKRRLKIASVLIMTTVFMTPVNAQTKPIEVEIPVHVDANEHVITITSPDAPLPVNRTQTLKNETKSFTVTLYEPKKYHYTLIDRNGQQFGRITRENYRQLSLQPRMVNIRQILVLKNLKKNRRQLLINNLKQVILRIYSIISSY